VKTFPLFIESEAGENYLMRNFVTYSSPNITRLIKSRRTRWTGYVTHMEHVRNAYTFFVGKPEGKSPLERIMSILEDNIRTDLKEI
jgi:hypothetical protein